MRTVSAQTQTYTESVISNFCGLHSDRQTGCAAGGFPNSIIQGSDGNFYGTTSQGGSAGDGTVFKITPSGSLTTLYSFCSQGGAACTDGFYPEATLLEGSDGNFYGTTTAGGNSNANNCVTGVEGYNGCGTVFKITPAGVLTTLYSFCAQGGICPDGSLPAEFGSLAEGSDGNFYGTTAFGGASGGGTAFKITPSGTLTTLYNFCVQGAGCSDGSTPLFGLIAGSDGNFYGSTWYAGNGGLPGTIFKMTPSGSLTTLYNFCTPNCGSGLQVHSLIEGNDGNFYGTTFYGGEYGAGTVFELTPSGTASRP